MAGQTATHKIEIIMGEMGTLNSYINTLESGFKRVADQIGVINTKMQEAMKGGTAGQALTTGGAVMPPGAQQTVAGGAQIQYTAASMEKLGDVARKLAIELDSVKEKQRDMLSALSDATDAQKKLITQDLQKSQIQEREIRNLQSMMPGGGGGGFFGMPDSMKGTLVGTAAMAAGIGAFPQMMLKGAAAMGGIRAAGAQAMGSTDFASMLRSDADYMGTASSMSKSYTTGRAIAEVLGAAAAGTMVGSPLLGAAAGAGTLITGLAGRWKGTYAANLEENLANLAKEQGITPVQYAESRNWAMGPGLGVAAATWSGRGEEKRLSSYFNTKNWAGRTSEDIGGALMGMTSFGGKAFMGDSRNRGMVNEIGYGLGTSATGAANILTSMAGGLSGSGGTAASDMDRFYQMMKKAVSDGIGDAPNMNRFMDTVVSLAQTAGGPMDTAFLSRIMMATYANEGERGDLNARLAKATADIYTSDARASGGIAAQANWRAAGITTQKWQNKLKLDHMGEFNMLLSRTDEPTLSFMRKEGYLDSFFKNKGDIAPFIADFKRKQISEQVGVSPFRGVFESLPEVMRKLNTGESLNKEETRQLAFMKTLTSGQDLMETLAYGKNIDEAIGTRELTVKGKRRGASGGWGGTKDFVGFEAITKQTEGMITNVVQGLEGFINTIAANKETSKQLLDMAMGIAGVAKYSPAAAKGIAELADATKWAAEHGSTSAGIINDLKRESADAPKRTLKAGEKFRVLRSK